MANLFVKESWVEITKTDDEEERRLGLGESDVYETFTDNRGDLYRSLQKTYGRCVSKVYHGEKDPKEIGWVFVQRQKYQDADETYLQETWVTVHTQIPTKTIKYHYA
jgi:hypothetical protein